MEKTSWNTLASALAEDMRELEAYRRIGSVEECESAVRQVRHSSEIRICPHCGQKMLHAKNVFFCVNCD